MLFRIEKNNQDTWNISPLSGELKGVTIGTADAISLESVSISGSSLSGAIQAMWGLVILDDRTYSDIDTLRNLRLNKAFHMLGQWPLDLNSEGPATDRNSGRYVHTATHIVVFGPAIYRKGW